MLAAIILAHDLCTIMLSCRPACYLDSLRIWFQLAKSLHQGTSNDRGPAVRRLHDLDSRINGCTDSLSKIGTLSKTADEENRFDFLLGGSNLTSDQCYDFVHDRIEDGFDLGTVHLELAPSDTLGWIVGQSGD